MLARVEDRRAPHKHKRARKVSHQHLLAALLVLVQARPKPANSSGLRQLGSPTIAEGRPAVVDNPRGPWRATNWLDPSTIAREKSRHQTADVEWLDNRSCQVRWDSSLWDEVSPIAHLPDPARLRPDR